MSLALGDPARHLALLERMRDAAIIEASGRMVEVLYVVPQLDVQPSADEPPVFRGAHVVWRVGGILRKEPLDDPELAALCATLDMIERRLGARRPPMAAPGRADRADEARAL